MGSRDEDMVRSMQQRSFILLALALWCAAALPLNDEVVLLQGEGEQVKQAAATTMTSIQSSTQARLGDLAMKAAQQRDGGAGEIAAAASTPPQPTPEEAEKTPEADAATEAP